MKVKKAQTKSLEESDLKSFCFVLEKASVHV